MAVLCDANELNDFVQTGVSRLPEKPELNSSADQEVHRAMESTKWLDVK